MGGAAGVRGRSRGEAGRGDRGRPRVALRRGKVGASARLAGRLGGLEPFAGRAGVRGRLVALCGRGVPLCQSRLQSLLRRPPGRRNGRKRRQTGSAADTSYLSLLLGGDSEGHGNEPRATGKPAVWRRAALHLRCGVLPHLRLLSYASSSAALARPSSAWQDRSSLVARRAASMRCASARASAGGGWWCQSGAGGGAECCPSAGEADVERSRAAAGVGGAP